MRVCAIQLAAPHLLHGKATSLACSALQAQAAAQLDQQRRVEEAALASEAQRRADAEQAALCEAQARRACFSNQTAKQQ